MTSPLEARLAEAEAQCMHERRARLQLATLCAQFLERAVPLINDVGLVIDVGNIERDASPTQRGGQ